jgi:hypothetical protein
MIDHLKKIGVIAISLFLSGGILSHAFAQESSNDDGFFEGIEEYAEDQAKQQVLRQVENACQATRLAARAKIAADDFLGSVDNIFVQPFIDLQRSNCYRTVVWELDDKVEELTETYAQAVQNECVQRTRAGVKGDESSAQSAAQAGQNTEELFDEISLLKRGTYLLRTYGNNGSGIKTDDVIKIYGFAEMNDDLYKEVFDYQSDINDHPYYCPYFQNGNVLGAQIPVLEWHPHYEDILNELSKEDRKDERKKRKRVLQECRAKWSAMTSSVESFLVAYESNTLGDSYPLAAELSDQQKASLASSIESAELIIPYIKKRSNMCTDDVVADFVDLVNKIINFKPADFAEDIRLKIIEKQKQARITMYQDLCNKVIQARKRLGATLKTLPYYTTIDGVDYCTRPDNADSSLGEAFQSALNKSLKAMGNPKKLDEIILEKTDANITEVMNKQLAEWAKYQFTYDIARQRAMYKALYDTGGDGVSTAIQNLMNDFISVLQTTISVDPAKTGELAMPITKAIWDTFYELQERQRCGSCSVQQDDLKIIKSNSG